MKMKWWLMFAVSVFPVWNVSAQETKEAVVVSRAALDYMRIDLEDSFSQFARERGWEYAVARTKQFFIEAVAVVQAYPPEGDHLFNWQGDRNCLEGKEFMFAFATSGDPFIPAGTKTDGVWTFTGRSRETGRQMIVVFLLVDQLMFDGDEPRKDALARIASAVASAVYGPVQDLLKRNFSSESWTYQTQIGLTQKGTTAEVDFLEKVAGDPRFAEMNPELRADFKNLLDAKRETLDRLFQQNVNIEIKTK